MQSALPVQKQRINSIDILRGIIMVIMALDHVRDYFTNVPYDPLDLTKASTALFLTRWITHFCAPTFIFLSGCSAFLSLSKKKTKKQASLFLLTRGLWLLLLEVTIISFGWQFDASFHNIIIQVIWAIGWSMIVLSALIYLKPIYIGLFGLILIFGHNAFDYVRSDSWGHYKLFWMFLHEQNFYQINSYESILILYPIIPWIGVMAAGYAFGPLFKMEPAVRKSIFIKIGLSSLTIFIILRSFNIYGDPFPWQPQATWWRDVLAIIKCHKYPPSLLYLLMTLGIAILALAALETANNKLTRIFTVYGRVPMFYYVPHIYIIHILQIVIGLLSGFALKQFTSLNFLPVHGWGYSLPLIYLIWLSVVAVLYFPCRWYMKIKQSRTDWWLSYL